MKVTIILSCLALATATPVERPGELRSIGLLEDKEFFYQEDGTNMNWADAMDLCHDNLLNLARIESVLENDAVTSFADGTSSFWLAATDLAYEGEFRSLKDNRAITYSNFDGDNTKLTNCAAIGGTGVWEYASCGLGQHKVLCESL